MCACVCIHTDLGWVRAREVRSQRQRRQLLQQQQPRQPQQQQQLGTSEFRPRIPSLHHAGTPIPFSKTTTHHHQSPNRSNRNTNHNTLLFLFSKTDRETKRERERVFRERERGKEKRSLLLSTKTWEALLSFPFAFAFAFPFAYLAFSPAFRQIIIIIIKRMHTRFHARECAYFLHSLYIFDTCRNLWLLVICPDYCGFFWMFFSLTLDLENTHRDTWSMQKSKCTEFEIVRVGGRGTGYQKFGPLNITSFTISR